MVVLEQLRPGLIAERAYTLGRSDKIGEEDRGEYSVGDTRWPHAREELLDLVDDVVRLPEGHVGVAGELDEARAGHMRGDIAALLDTRVAVADAMDDERRRLHRRQDIANVGLRIHHHKVTRRAGTCSRTRSRHPPPHERLVGARRHAR